MNGLYFLLPFLLVFLIGSASDFADADHGLRHVEGSDFTIRSNGDGTQTFTTHAPYVMNEKGEHVPFVQDGLNVRNTIGNVTLAGDGSFVWDGQFTDRIVVKYADVSDQTSWTYIDSLNNAVSDGLFVGDRLMSKKISTGVGILDYVYTVQNGQWKTEMSIQKTGGPDNRVFGFDQIIDVSEDVIGIGNITVDIDLLNGTTYDKAFLDSNNGSKITLNDGVEFDFDIGYPYLHSVTVHDTGADSSQIVFDYRDTTVLANGQTLVIDPVFTDPNSTSDQRVYDTLCDLTGTTFDNTTTVLVGKGGAGNCSRGYFEFDISSLPADIEVSDVTFTFATAASGSGTPTCQIYAMGSQPSVGSAAAVFTDAGDGTQYASVSCSASATSSNVVDLGTTADSDVETARSGAVDWFAIGVRSSNEATTNYSNLCAEENSCTPDPTLEITYTENVPDAVDDVSDVNLGQTSLDLIWTQPDLHGGNLTNYMVNSTTPWSSTTNFLANTTNTYYNVTGLNFGTDYSFSVSALTENGYNFTGNVLNITTPYTLYTGVAPTDLTVDDCAHACTTQLNLDWVADLMDNILGFRIYFETPVGGGFSTLVANTTTTTLYYNHTGLTAGQIYNYKVAAINGSGISGNSSSYTYSPHKLPDAVDDLVITTNDLLQFLGSWSVPTLNGPLTGYQVNYTTPAGDPQTIYTSTNPDTDIVISGLDPTTEHSFRVTAITDHGYNATGNIENATLTVPIVIGDLDLTVQTNTDVNPIWYELFNVDSTTDDVQVRFDSSLTVDCTVTDRLTNTDTSYTSLAETPASGYVYHNFTVTNAGNAILDWDCYDQTDATINGQYTLTQSSASSGAGGNANVPLFAQIGNFSDGLYGTEGELAGIDLITMLIVIVSMLGFNRYNPAVGVGVMATFLGAAWYFELIPWTSGAFGGIALILVLAIGQGMKKR